MANDAIAEGNEEPVRTVQDAQGRTWHVYPVIERTKVGAPHRASWLCLESGSDRRFISPVPDDWRRWSDAALLLSIHAARPDLRDS